MGKKQKEKRPAGKQSDGEPSAPPPNAAEGSPPSAPAQQRGKGKRGASKKPAQAKKNELSREVRPIEPGLRKRVRLAEAMRLEGLDERAVAETYVVVVEKLRNGTKDENGTQKALVDVLKECSRILEPPRGPGAGSGDVPAIVNLYHNVPRPMRDGQREHKDERRDEERSQE